MNYGNNAIDLLASLTPRVSNQFTCQRIYLLVKGLSSSWAGGRRWTKLQRLSVYALTASREGNESEHIEQARKNT